MGREADDRQTAPGANLPLSAAADTAPRGQCLYQHAALVWIVGRQAGTLSPVLAAFHSNFKFLGGRDDVLFYLRLRQT